MSLLCKDALVHFPFTKGRTPDLLVICIICYTPTLPVDDKMHVHGACRCANGLGKRKKR